MNEHKRPDMKGWEDSINALMDGELDPGETAALKLAATDDRKLARTIIDAYQLQQALASIPVEQAPASLRKKLRRIPRDQRVRQRPDFLRPRWAMALAAIPLVILVVNLAGPREPTEAELAQARQDLAIAFAYIEKVSNRTGKKIDAVVGSEMNDAVTGSVIRTIQHQTIFEKEKQA